MTYINQDIRYTWTFIVDFEGGTYISQFKEKSMAQAIEAYNKTDPSGRGIVPLSTDPSDAPVAIAGLTSVWCTSGFTEVSDKHFLVNIVKTDCGAM